jgi:hypothetical protein
MGGDPLIGKRVQPIEKGDVLAACQHGPGHLLNQSRRPLEIPSGEGVVDGLGKQPVPLVPLAGPAMELRHELGPIPL